MAFGEEEEVSTLNPSTGGSAGPLTHLHLCFLSGLKRFGSENQPSSVPLGGGPMG